MKVKREMVRRTVGILLSAAMACSMMPSGRLFVYAWEEQAGLRERCTEHKHASGCGLAETGQGADCTYVYMEDDTEDNIDKVRVQPDESKTSALELARGEQEQLDLPSGCRLQAVLDESGVPMSVERKASIDYKKASWTGSAVAYTDETAECTLVTADAAAWTDGWYAVNGEITVSDPITVSGAVNLILADSCILNALSGIAVTEGNSLAIYAQSAGSGALNAVGVYQDGNVGGSAGIGGTGDVPNSGAVTIHGGVINVVGGISSSGFCSAAGIGGGSSSGIAGSWDGGSSGAIIIYGGSVTAKSDGSGAAGAGIGGGGGSWDGGNGNNIKIYGGIVKAVGGTYGAGIGGGGGGGGSSGNASGTGSDITISGGQVTAVGGKYAAGIGGGGGFSANIMGIVTNFTGGIGTGISITGGIVDASSEQKVFYEGYEGDPIGNGGNAGGDSDAARTAGIIFENGRGLVYGNVAFTGTYAVPADYTLTIPAGACLSGDGILSGGAEFITRSLTEDLIAVSGDFTYNGSDLSEEIKKRVTAAQTAVICGREFQVDADGWTAAVSRASGLEYTVTYTHTGGTAVSKTIAVSPAALTDDMVTLSATEFTYNGRPQQPEIIVSGLTLDTDYEVAFSAGDFTKAGTVEVTISGKGNYAGTVTRTYTVKKAVLTAAGSGTAAGSYGVKLSELTVKGLTVCMKDSGGEVSGAWKFMDDCVPNAGDNGPYRAVFVPESGAENYEQLQADVTLTISKAAGQLDIADTDLKKTYGEPEFALGCSTDGDGKISYASDKEDVVLVSSDGTAVIKGAGTAVITVSLLDGNNYSGGVVKTVTVTVAKKAAPKAVQETRQYISQKGSGGEKVEIDVAGKLPADRGETTYTCTSQDADGVLADVAFDAFDSIEGKLSYKVNAGSTGSTASITVTAQMANYERTTFTLNISMVDIIQAEITAEAEDVLYDGCPHKGYQGGISCDYPVGGYTFAYAGRGGTEYDSADPPVNAGNYTVTIRVADDSGDYEGDLSLDFIIAKASVTVRADDKTAKAGDILPRLTYTVYGLAEKDRFLAEPVLSSSADMKKAGVYPITVNGAKVPDTANYDENIAYEAGKLTVLEGSTESGSGGGSGTGSGGSGTGSGGGDSGTGGGGSGTGSGGSWYPGGSTGSGLKQPFIKDSSGRKGWDVIRAAAETAADGTVAVDMNGASKVPGDVLGKISGRNVTLAFDMGGGFIWSVRGADILSGAVSDTDFSIKAGTGYIPQDIIGSAAGSLAHLELSLAHNGTFGFTAVLSVQIIEKENGTAAIGGAAAESGRTYSGMYANLFYYNPQLRSLEFICADRIAEDGTAQLPFIHASDYAVIISAQPMGGKDPAESPQEPEENACAQVQSVKLSKKVYTYNGKAARPSVTAVDTDGRQIPDRCYTVIYKNNKKVGRAIAVVDFKDGYSGTVKKAFTIRPAGTSVKKITAVSGGFVVKWAKKTTQTSGYQIQYSTDREFRKNSACSVFVKKASVAKKAVKRLKAGKRYYVRIRTYKTVKAGGESTKVYSAWSGAVRVKIPTDDLEDAAESK